MIKPIFYKGYSNGYNFYCFFGIIFPISPSFLVGTCVAKDLVQPGDSKDPTNDLFPLDLPWIELSLGRPFSSHDDGRYLAPVTQYMATATADYVNICFDHGLSLKKHYSLGHLNFSAHRFFRTWIWFVMTKRAPVPYGRMEGYFWSCVFSNNGTEWGVCTTNIIYCWNTVYCYKLSYT